MNRRISSFVCLMAMSAGAGAAQAPAAQEPSPQAEVAGMAGLTVMVGLPRWTAGLQAEVAQQARQKMEQMAANPHRVPSPAIGRAAADKAGPKIDAIIQGCFAEIETGIRGTLEKSLAASELAALKDFGRSPPGQAILAKGARAFQDDTFIAALTPAETAALRALGQKRGTDGSLTRVLPQVRQKFDQTLRDAMKCMEPKMARVVKEFEAEVAKR